MASKRVVFTFGERALRQLRELQAQMELPSMAETVRQSLMIAKTLRDQAEAGFTEVLMRDPKSGREAILVGWFG